MISVKGPVWVDLGGPVPEYGYARDVWQAFDLLYKVLVWL